MSWLGDVLRIEVVSAVEIVRRVQWPGRDVFVAAGEVVGMGIIGKVGRIGVCANVEVLAGIRHGADRIK